MNKFVIRLSIALALGAGLVVIAPAQPAGAAYTSAQIEDMLENGVATAHSMDAYCFDYMRSLGYSSNFTSTGYGDLRTVINEGSAYDYATWLSKRGQGNAAVPVTVNAGTTVLPLQINDVLFLCGHSSDQILMVRRRVVRVSMEGTSYTLTARVVRLPRVGLLTTGMRMTALQMHLVLGVCTPQKRLSVRKS